MLAEVFQECDDERDCSLPFQKFQPSWGKDRNMDFVGYKYKGSHDVWGGGPSVKVHREVSRGLGWKAGD